MEDLTEENIIKAFNNAPANIQESIIDAMKNRGFTFSDLADNRRGKIARVFGNGGGVQIHFGSSLIYYEDLGLIREVKIGGN
ncbi:RNA-binding protein [Streptococcus equi]|uniref:hypothetical protein n=1 Tax=Streptococcus equi TaxID=1336 RepID=UPI000698B035|nr:hypothetical protein [Streptococcus equi]MCD3404105.1 hypothetical protein [Streptococcus equi subsp. zooepidemicus]HEL0677280.1 hypothetical protein [Streptococcus equi subsp. zooepidemicus]HEL1198365.1 hypothetical protein [Streptococcus equi subsp. zooepidemicus]